MVLNWVSIHTPLLPQNQLNPHGKLSLLKFQREILLFKSNSLNNNTTINSGKLGVALLHVPVTNYLFQTQVRSTSQRRWSMDSTKD